MIVWAVPAELEMILVIPTPTSISWLYFSKVSLVILLFTSSTTTLPTKSDCAKDLAASGSETGLSLSVWGNKSWTGWGKLSSLNGVIVGLLEEFNKVK